MKRSLLILGLAMFCTLVVTENLSSQTATAPSGSGTSGSPYLIATLDNLYWVTQNSSSWGSYFEQTANIDASTTSGWASGSGFSPIGNGTASFTGTYDGQGYSIDSLFISRSSTDNVGLFGLVSDANIRKVHLTNLNITGQSSVGGLVGFCTGSGSAVIDSSSTTGTVTGSGSQAMGGLVGAAQAGSTISSCYSTARVNGTNQVGGLVGHNDQVTVVSNCYSTGRINASGSGIGGLVGYNLSTFPGPGQIVNSYTVSALVGTGSSQVGGFVGGNLGTISNSFWNTDSSGSTGIGAGSSSGATGETSAQMKTLSTFTSAGWDFVLETTNGSNDYWDMDTTNKVINNGYPFLSWQNGGSTALPVQMVSFTARPIQLNAELRWMTSSEVDCAGFDVERRTIDDFGFSIADWKKVASVAGAGTSTGLKQYSFVDHNLSSGRYSYRLKQIDRTGAFEYSKEMQVFVGSAPREFSLGQNYPNPFNPTTTFEFTLPTDGRVSLKIYDNLGREVAVLLDETRRAGVYQQAVFDGSRFASGLYFARLQFGGKQLLKKMLMVK